jgi:hypothetical protein
LFVTVAKEWKRSGRLASRQAWPAACHERKRTMQRKSHFDEIPIKPQRVYHEMNTCHVTVIGLSQIAGAQFLRVYNPRNWINAGQAGPLGWTLPAALSVRAADPNREIVALSGDYDFQFLIEELAVGAQFKLPYIHVVVNNSYLGLIRQAQRGFDMDIRCSCRSRISTRSRSASTASIMSRSPKGSAAKRSASPIPIARRWRSPRRAILERVTNIAMGTEIDNIVEFEETLDLPLDEVRAVAKCCCRSEVNHAQICRQPHHAVQRDAVPGSLCRRQGGGLCRGRISLSLEFDKADLRERLNEHGLTQVLHNLPAGNWAKGERGIAILPDRVDEFRDGVVRAVDYAKALNCHPPQLPHRHRARRCRPARARTKCW